MCVYMHTYIYIIAIVMLWVYLNTLHFIRLLIEGPHGSHKANSTGSDIRQTQLQILIISYDLGQITISLSPDLFPDL